MEQIFTELIKIILEAIIVSGILGYFFLNREERLKKTIEAEFKKRDTYFNAQFDYKRRALEEVLGPIMMQLKRSSIALRVYKPNDGYQEAILKQCNEIIRDLILAKGYLIPPDLQLEAGEFLEHYDGWLQHYHQLREVEKNIGEAFVFTHNFPHAAEKKFEEKYRLYRNELKIDEAMGTNTLD